MDYEFVYSCFMTYLVLFVNKKIPLVVVETFLLSSCLKIEI